MRNADGAPPDGAPPDETEGMGAVVWLLVMVVVVGVVLFALRVWLS